MTASGIFRFARARWGVVLAAVLIPTLAQFAVTAPAGAATGADLSVKLAAKASASNDTTGLTYTIKNAGPSAATNVTLTILMNAPNFSSIVFPTSSLPASCQFVGAPTGFNVAATCTTASMASKATWKLTGSTTGSANGSLTIVSEIADDPSVPDPKPTNNSVTTTSSYGPAADLMVTETGAAGATTGTAIAAVTVSNLGPMATTGISFTAELVSPGVTGATYPSGTNWFCAGTTPAAGYNGAVKCTLGGPPLAKGKSSTLALTYSGPSGGPLRSDVSVQTSAATDLQSANNSATVDTTYR